jgi:hypothetical protein
MRQASTDALKNAPAFALAVPAEKATGAGPAAMNSLSSSAKGACAPWSYKGKPDMTIFEGQSSCLSAYQSGNMPMRQSASLIQEPKILVNGGKRSAARSVLSGFVKYGSKKNLSADQYAKRFIRAGVPA